MFLLKESNYELELHRQKENYRSKILIMENRNEVEKPDLLLNQNIKANLNLLRNTFESKGSNQEIDLLLSEGGESFYNYVEWLGLIKDPNMIILSSVHHYYFDTDDLKGVNTIINLKQLNLIKNINNFFQSISKIVPAGSNFIGSFLDNKTLNGFAINNISSQYTAKSNSEYLENGITSRIPFLNMIYNLVDSKTNKNLTKKVVSAILVDQRFKILDMTEFNGLTYFHAQKVRVFNN